MAVEGKAGGLQGSDRVDGASLDWLRIVDFLRLDLGPAPLRRP